jgi:predicted porin
MKKHLIAAAVAGAFAVPAMAQVTVSGTLIFDPLNTQKVKTQAGTAASANTKDSQTSYIGARSWTASQLQFSGSEDLGGGLRASFVTTLDLRNEGAAGTAHFNRDQNLALSGGFGTVRLGRFVPASAMAWHGFSGAGSTTAGAFYSLGTGGAGNTQNAALVGGSFERNSNQIQYTTPTISGFTFNVSFGEDKTDISTQDGKRETKQRGISATYAAGPLSFGLGTNEREGEIEAADAVAPVTATSSANGVLGTAAVANSKTESGLDWLGASYDLGVARISVAHVMREGSNITAAGVNTKANDMEITGLGVSVPMGAMTLRASAYDGKNKLTVATDDNLDLSGYQVSVVYSLSKRTSAYALIGEHKIKRATGNTAGTARTTSGSIIGLMHSF